MSCKTSGRIWMRSLERMGNRLELTQFSRSRMCHGHGKFANLRIFWDVQLWYHCNGCISKDVFFSDKALNKTGWKRAQEPTARPGVSHAKSHIPALRHRQRPWWLDSREHSLLIICSSHLLMSRTSVELCNRYLNMHPSRVRCSLSFSEPDLCIDFTAGEESGAPRGPFWIWWSDHQLCYSGPNKWEAKPVVLGLWCFCLDTPRICTSIMCLRR